jgi:hypothetical protein
MAVAMPANTVSPNANQTLFILLPLNFCFDIPDQTDGSSNDGFPYELKGNPILNDRESKRVIADNMAKDGLAVLW